MWAEGRCDINVYSGHFSFRFHTIRSLVNANASDVSNELFSFFFTSPASSFRKFNLRDKLRQAAVEAQIFCRFYF